MQVKYLQMEKCETYFKITWRWGWGGWGVKMRKQDWPWVSNSWRWVMRYMGVHYASLSSYEYISCCIWLKFSKTKFLHNKWKRRKTILTGLVIVKIFLSLKINLGNRTRGFLEEAEKELIFIYQMSTGTRYSTRGYLITILTTNSQGPYKYTHFTNTEIMAQKGRSLSHALHTYSSYNGTRRICKRLWVRGGVDYKGTHKGWWNCSVSRLWW